MMKIEVPNLINLKDKSINHVYYNVILEIKLRNKIVHRNFNNITEFDCSGAIDSIISLIHILETKANIA